MALSPKAKYSLTTALGDNEVAEEVIAEFTNSESGTGTSIAPSVSQLMWVNYLSGSDVTGDGSFEKPYATVNKGMSMITDASQNKPYSIMLGACRQIETGGSSTKTLCLNCWYSAKSILFES